MEPVTLSVTGFFFCCGAGNDKRWSITLDLAQLSQLPIAVLALLGAYWAIQRNNAAYQEKLIELIAQFTEKFTALGNRAHEEREDDRQRWMERDRQLIALVIDAKDTILRSNGEVKEALINSTNQDHALRSQLQPIVLWWQREQKNTGNKTRQGDDINAAG